MSDRIKSQTKKRKQKQFMPLIVRASKSFINFEADSKFSVSTSNISTEINTD